uniref:39S ribosomal protein L4, mitochondrial n=1 Tax=Panagrolaimus sp. ES5 TaxID=591445 RepID=A0AC34GUP9_9BILA
MISTLFICSKKITPSCCSFRQISFLNAQRDPFNVTPEAYITTLSDVEEKNVDIIKLNPTIFRTTPRIDLLHRNITWQQNYRNLQLTKQLSRAEMPGGGRKPWPQKKVSRHHAGSIRSPHFKFGGFAHGVRGPRTWFYMLPDSVRLKGLCTALTIKHVQNDLVIADNFNSISGNDSQFLHDLAEKRNWGYSILFVDKDSNMPTNFVDAIQNIPSFTAIPLYGLNCFSIMKHDTLVFSKQAIDALEEKLVQQFTRTESLHKKFRYIDYKDVLLGEGEHEEDPIYPPFV